LRAQDFDDNPGEDGKRPSVLSLSVTLSESGQATVAAYAFTRNNSGDLKPALESALHCTLQSRLKLQGRASGRTREESEALRRRKGRG
jgi:hypothetical protein